MSNRKTIPTSCSTGGIRSAYLDAWHETVVFNREDVDDGQVMAQGQTSGKYYILTIDNLLDIVDAELYF